MRLLSLGCCSDAAVVTRILDGLHGAHGIDALLVDQGTSTDAAVYCWSTHRAEALCPVHAWPGVMAASKGLRPPVTGIDRVRTILIEAAGHADRVMVWGLAPGFDQGKRRSAWDVPAEAVAQEAVALGWEGWRWAGRRQGLISLPVPSQPAASVGSGSA